MTEISSQSSSNLKFSLEELEENYKGTPLEGQCHILFGTPTSEADFIENYLVSKLWRLNNLYHIINKQGELVCMRMNRAQHITYAAFLKHPRLLILKSRQQGISTFWLVFFFDTLIFYPNKKAGLMSQGLDESAELLDKLSVLWRHMDQDILNELDLTKAKDNSKLFELSNGSKMLVRTSFRSGTLQMLHISEMGKIANAYPARAREVKSGSLQALAKGLPGIVESTAEGVNEFKYMWDTAVAFVGELTHKDFAPLFLPWTEDPDCISDVPQAETKEGSDYFATLEAEYDITVTQEQKWFWEAQFRELGLDTYQEYPATPEEAFKAALEGAYYGSYVAKYITRGTNRIRLSLYNPALPVTVSADLGINDEFVLAFWQYYNGEHRLIREYYNTDKITQHYVEICKFYYNDNIAQIILPHDAAIRDNNTLETRYEVFEDAFPGVDVLQLEKTPSIIDDIQHVRRFLPKLIIDKECVYLYDCLQNYSKEKDEKRNVWKPNPKHDEFSHGADVIRCYVIGNTAEQDWLEKYDRRQEIGYDYDDGDEDDDFEV